MIQWFRGTIEADYVGRPQKARYPSRHPGGEHFRIELLRGTVHTLEWLEPPDESPKERAEEGAEHVSHVPAAAPQAAAPGGESSGPPDMSTTHLFQSELPQALLVSSDPVGKRRWLEGPLFDISVTDFELERSVRHGAHTYGRLRGDVTGWFVLKDEPGQLTPRERLEALSSSDSESPSCSSQSDSNPDADPGAEPEGDLELHHEEEHDAEDSPPRSRTTPARRSEPSFGGAPLFLLFSVVALALFVGCGVGQAVIWCAFFLPTLLLRRILHDELPDTPGVRGFGAVLICVQLLAAAWLVAGWWTAGCKELHVLPLLVLAFGMFVSAILPSGIPLFANSSALGVVLFAWCGPLGARCHPELNVEELERRPSVERPAQPRTNDDGSWPRHPTKQPETPVE